MSSSRLSSRDSYHRKDRVRSPSPSEYFRTRLSNLDQMFDRTIDMDEFIYNGIAKFLDKQAVRDLLNEFDANDIFIGGEENFYDNLYDDEDDDEGESSAQNRLQNIVKKFSNMDPKRVQGSRAKRPPDLKKVLPQKKKSITSLSTKAVMDKFYSLVFVKLFQVRAENRSQTRRESEMFDAHFP